ncbi:hypothetical protein FraQA3DRAFT_0547 [Frankia sp. QA3]|nr:hypothetical protein FraQA3DRAFT_0547 [Frankia sp. QA3]
MHRDGPGRPRPAGLPDRGCRPPGPPRPCRQARHTAPATPTARPPCPGADPVGLCPPGHPEGRYRRWSSGEAADPPEGPVAPVPVATFATVSWSLVPPHHRTGVDLAVTAVIPAPLVLFCLLSGQAGGPFAGRHRPTFPIVTLIASLLALALAMGDGATIVAAMQAVGAHAISPMSPSPGCSPWPRGQYGPPRHAAQPPLPRRRGRSADMAGMGRTTVRTRTSTPPHGDRPNRHRGVCNGSLRAAALSRSTGRRCTVKETTARAAVRARLNGRVCEVGASAIAGITRRWVWSRSRPYPGRRTMQRAGVDLLTRPIDLMVALT